MVSGFDDEDVISEMDTRDGLNNSITVIVDKRKSDLPNCMSPTNLSHLPFEFPPGHRIRIENFINQVKRKRNPELFEPLPIVKRNSKKLC